MELKKEIDQLKEVNGFLQHQISLNSGLEEQNVELKKELDNVRGENQILGLSLDGFVVRLERLLSDVDLNAKEQTLAFPDKVV
ncbi:Serine/threonine-protein phosphatase 7 long form like [Quillaja saponaria]|uniref:Serine/threonine-protein phosphatase 7 long form like n=1 Tax=Quillaja saponaria TaxID=32244 RepID=A0AAD7PMX7_QUISA|nr:Serine/threonine-protein phosphatase 7 long form like [Quillaja saponaria]